MIVGKTEIKYSRIDEPLYFLDNGTLLERYELKSIRKSNVLATIDNNELKWNSNKARNFFERRGNFENITLFAVTDAYSGGSMYNQFPKNLKEIAPNSDLVPNTYEVCNKEAHVRFLQKKRRRRLFSYS